jgi:hypothetical protein
VSTFAVSLTVFITVAALVLAVELAGLSDRVPWNSLTWTLGQLMARSWGFVVYPAIAAGLLIFLLHIGKHQHDKRDEPEGRN